jgi:hypothetical protein|tara:strand:+ start:1474 stop:1848 length:375 start_codon:yes stop_codon:yes gene_type:complete
MATAKKTKPALWARAKAQAKARMGGKHSARAMQLAVKIYKKAGGGYRGSKSSSNKLTKWGKQKWQTSSGKKSEGKRRYLPKKAWKALTAKEKSATNAAKARGNKKGKQFVKQPKSIAAKTKRFR